MIKLGILISIYGLENTILLLMVSSRATCPAFFSVILWLLVTYVTSNIPCLGLLFSCFLSFWLAVFFLRWLPHLRKNSKPAEEAHGHGPLSWAASSHTCAFVIYMGLLGQVSVRPLLPTLVASFFSHSNSFLQSRSKWGFTELLIYQLTAKN